MLIKNKSFEQHLHGILSGSLLIIFSHKNYMQGRVPWCLCFLSSFCNLRQRSANRTSRRGASKQLKNYPDSRAGLSSIRRRGYSRWKSLLRKRQRETFFCIHYPSRSKNRLKSHCFERFAWSMCRLNIKMFPIQTAVSSEPNRPGHMNFQAFPFRVFQRRIRPLAVQIPA